MAHKIGTTISGAWQFMSRKDKRELKRSFKKREDVTNCVKVEIATLCRIASKDTYDSVWPRSERYPHFKYIANKLQ